MSSNRWSSKSGVLPQHVRPWPLPVVEAAHLCHHPDGWVLCWSRRYVRALLRSDKRSAISILLSLLLLELNFCFLLDAIQSYTGGNLTVYGPRETASIFSSYPAPYLTIANGFLDQVISIDLCSADCSCITI